MRAPVTKAVIVNNFAYVNRANGRVALSSAHSLADRNHQLTVFSAIQLPAEPMPHFPQLGGLQHGPGRREA